MKMDKKLKQILIDIEFVPRYLDLFNKHETLEGEAYLLKDEIFDIFKELDFDVKFDSKEKFFGHQENEEDTDFELNFVIDNVNVNFVLFVFSKKHKLKAGGPYGLFANRLDKKMKLYPTIRFNDYESLKEALKVGIELFHEIKAEYLKLIRNE